jgi:Tannase and feruloyl esterase
MRKFYSNAARILAALIVLVASVPSRAVTNTRSSDGAGTPYPNLPVVKAAHACSELHSVELGDIGGAGSRITNAVEASNHGIPICTVEGLLEPAIGFKVTLPAQSWTQRYLQVGCGGLCGRVSLDVGAADGCVSLQAGGFVIASTDMGHQGTGAEFGADPGKRADFAYRAVHLTALAAKKLIFSFYDRREAYAYFSGCSDGGREALIEAQRYPTDFNGIIAGAAASNFQVQQGLFHAWQARSNTGKDGKPILIASRLPVLHRAVLEACDGLDGQNDGLISNPLACHFDPGKLLCPAQSEGTANCLTAAEVDVVRKLYDGPHDPVTGERLTIAGPLFGSELAWAGIYVPESTDQPITSETIAVNALRYLLFKDNPPADFNLANVNFDRTSFDRLQSLHPLYDATNPDLSAFSRSGGKLILWHGWADARVSPVNTIAYHKAIERLMGRERTETFERAYLFPGTSHCGGGEGPNEFDLLTPMLNWVEKGRAPDAIIASQLGKAASSNVAIPTAGSEAVLKATSVPAALVVQARPVYPFPYMAAYDGQGDPTQASSYARGTALSIEIPRWAGADLYRPYKPHEY